MMEPSKIKEPIAWTHSGFYSFDTANNSWKTIHKTYIYCALAINGSRAIFKQKQDDDLWLIDLSQPSPKATNLAEALTCDYEDMGPCFANNNVYLVGGWHRRTFDVVQNMNFLKTTTKEITAKSQMSVKRYAASPILFKKCIYVVGGTGPDSCGGLFDVEKFDIRTGEWSTLAFLNIQRSQPVLIVHHQLLYAIGGGYKQKSVEVYDFAKDSWRLIAPVPCHTVVSAMIIQDELVVITRQGRVFRYDESGNKWRKFPPLTA